MARRTFGLDLLRAIAILMVLANHAFLSFFVDLGHATFTGVAAVVSTVSILSIEWLFVLSGFLIGAMMIRSFEEEGSWWSRARSFWLRRWFRTFPAYFLFLLVNIVLVAIHVAPGAFSVRYLLFAQNLAWPMQAPYFFVESWTLALDEWFYVAMPILVGLGALLLGRDRRRSFLVAALLLIAVPTLLRWLAAPAVTAPDWDARFRGVTVMHLDATGWGVLGAIASRWWPASWTRGVRGKAILGLAFTLAGLLMLEALSLDLAVWYRFPRLWSALPLTLIGGGALMLLPWVAGLRPRGGVVGLAVEHLSLTSYALYLAHLPLAFLLRSALTAEERASVPAVAVQVVLWFLLCLAASALLYHRFEKPIFDLRERFTRKVDANPFTPQA